MLVLLLNWIFIFFITYVFGYTGLELLSRLTKTTFNSKIHPTLLSLTGLALITGLANYTSLFFRINIEFVAVLSITGVLLAWFNRKKIYSGFTNIKVKNIHPLTLFFALAFFLIAIFKAVGPTEIMDDGEYYLPLIRWIEQYPVLPGTALFHDRMGYNSSFHMSSAIFGHVYWFKGGLYDLNGYLFLIINIYFLSGVNRLIRNISRYTVQDYLMLFAGIALYRQLLTSIDSNYPYIFIGIVLLLLFIEKANLNTIKIWDTKAHIFLILALYIITVKFLAVYFLLFICVLLYQQWRQRNFRLISFVLVFGVIFIFPWLARNVVLTGYLVYPVYLIDFFNVEWKIPIEIARNNYLYVSEHAKTLTVRHSLYYEGVAHVPLNQWLPQWWTNHAKTIISSLITAVALPPSLILLSILLTARGKKLIQENSGLLITLAISLIFLVFWFFQYPSVRFGWPWILFIIVFTMIKFNEQFIKLPQQFIRFSALVLLALGLLRGVSKTFSESDQLGRHLIFPEQVTELKAYTTKRIGSYEIRVSKDKHCWGIDPPCMPVYYDELQIELRGTDFKKGFKVQK
jgi:hypothetical protein